MEIGGNGQKAEASVDRPDVVEGSGNEKGILESLGGIQRKIVRGDGLRETACVAICLTEGVCGEASGVVVFYADSTIGKEGEAGRVGWEGHFGSFNLYTNALLDARRVGQEKKCRQEENGYGTGAHSR